MKKDLKERLKSGEKVLGTWNGIPSATVVNAIGLSGVDFVVIDSLSSYSCSMFSEGSCIKFDSADECALFFGISK